MNFCVCDEEGADELRSLNHNGMQTLVEAAREGGKSVPPEIYVGAKYHRKCWSKTLRNLKKNSSVVEPRSSHRREFHMRLDCLFWLTLFWRHL